MTEAFIVRRDPHAAEKAGIIYARGQAGQPAAGVCSWNCSGANGFDLCPGGRRGIWEVVSPVGRKGSVIARSRASKPAGLPLFQRCS
jgi:hypothetical protein